MSADLYTPGSCQKILAEIGPLLLLYHKSRTGLERLQELLDQHSQDNVQGNNFRSFCCYGTPGKSVPLEVFNDLCVLPATNYCVQLAQTEVAGAITPSSLEQDEIKKHLDDFAATACALCWLGGL